MIVLHGNHGEVVCLRLDAEDADVASFAHALALEVHLPGCLIEVQLGREAAHALLAGLTPLVAALGRSLTVPDRSRAILRPVPGGAGSLSEPPHNRSLDPIVRSDTTNSPKSMKHKV